MNKFSIIIPVRNGGIYIKECMKGILNQTFRDFNVIVLNNNSDDGTLEWLSTLKDDRITIYDSAKTLTIEENWGRIRDIPKNEFMTLIGHDDILYPDFLEKINELIRVYPCAGLYHTHFDFIDSMGAIIRCSKPMNLVVSPTELLTGFMTQSIDTMGTGYVMRSAEYDAIGGIPVEYPNLLFADFELWLRLAGKNGMVVSPDTSFAFRVHKGTTGTSADSKLHKAFARFVDFLGELKALDPKNENIISKNGSQFLLFYCKGFCHRLLRDKNKAENGITVDGIIRETKYFAKKLGVEEHYHPEKIKSIWIAKKVDKNKILSFLFLLFKKIYPKPIL